ncbi:MAG TPA: NUDIX domain-containing protein [Chlamydiales bacterium]|nr:NUDIX domain-containing protein [Chlamydiales bacterium]
MKTYEKKSRTGVYGVAIQDKKILLVVQPSGVHAGKFDLPGGGIEYGETIEEALHREFAEEVAMTFDSFKFLINLTTTVEAFSFHQIGLIYQVDGLSTIQNGIHATHKYDWMPFTALSQETVTPFVWHICKGLLNTI